MMCRSSYYASSTNMAGLCANKRLCVLLLLLLQWRPAAQLVHALGQHMTCVSVSMLSLATVVDVYLCWVGKMMVPGCQLCLQQLTWLCVGSHALSPCVQQGCFA